MRRKMINSEEAPHRRAGNTRRSSAEPKNNSKLKNSMKSSNNTTASFEEIPEYDVFAADTNTESFDAAANYNTTAEYDDTVYDSAEYADDYNSNYNEAVAEDMGDVLPPPEIPEGCEPILTYRPRNKAVVALMVTVMVLVVGSFMLLAVSAGVMFARLNAMTTLDNETLSALDTPPEYGTVNVLLAGVDEDGIRSDTIMILSADNVDKEVKLLSIPRDTQIKLDGKVFKINACVGKQNGDKLLIDTISNMTNIPIHYYCKINFEGFIQIIDALGGVDFDVPCNMDYDDPAQNLHIHLKKGPQHLDGKAAHDIMRFRHNNKGAEEYAPGDYYKGDIGRIGTQQDLMMELFRQKMTPTYLAKAPELIDVASKYVRTNFDVSTAMGFVSMLKTSETSHLQTFLLPGTDGYQNGVSYFFYDKKATQELIESEFGYTD